MTEDEYVPSPREGAWLAGKGPEVAMSLPGEFPILGPDGMWLDDPVNGMTSADWGERMGLPQPLVMERRVGDAVPE
jgi:hypothetical protein